MLEKIINLNFDNQLKDLAMCVYQGNESYKPNDWLELSEYNSKNSFYAQSFYKNGTVVISMKGTQEGLDWYSNGQMVRKIFPIQYSDAKKFYQKRRTFSIKIKLILMSCINSFICFYKRKNCCFIYTLSNY